MTAELPVTKVLLNELHVGAFRGLRGLALERLARVNLLVGGNNSGKTSVLEALAVLASPSDIAVWSSIASERETRPFGLGGGLSSIDAIRWLFPCSDTGPLGMSIEGMGQGTLFGKLEAECEAIRGFPARHRAGIAALPEDEGWRISGKTLLEGRNNEFVYELWPSLGFSRAESDRSQSRTPCVMLAPYSHRNQPVNQRRFSELTKAGTKFDVVEMLRDFDPSIIDLETLADDFTGVAYISVRQDRLGLIPASVMGDGFRRALAIALAIPAAQNGFLLIDEIETALHVSVLDKLFPWLMRTCKAYNVQLFATTHSLEAVSSMLNSAESLSPEAVAAYHLERHGAGQRATRYSLEMMKRMVRDRGLDIR